jgi:hypothetical protein
MTVAARGVLKIITRWCEVGQDSINCVSRVMSRHEQLNLRTK